MLLTSSAPVVAASFFSVDTQTVPIDVGDALLVTVASPEFVLFMKILSSRRSRQDFNDILDLCHFLGITDEVGIHVAVLPFGGVDGD